MTDRSWVEGVPVAITVTDADGTIVEMNARSRESYAEEGGGEFAGYVEISIPIPDELPHFDRD
jgi:hypothetical protein